MPSWQIGLGLEHLEDPRAPTRAAAIRPQLWVIWLIGCVELRQVGDEDDQLSDASDCPDSTARAPA